jgi:hypothetical protein
MLPNAELIGTYQRIKAVTGSHRRTYRARYLVIDHRTGVLSHQLTHHSNGTAIGRGSTLPAARAVADIGLCHLLTTVIDHAL